MHNSYVPTTQQIIIYKIVNITLKLFLHIESVIKSLHTKCLIMNYLRYQKVLIFFFKSFRFSLEIYCIAGISNNILVYQEK